MLGQPLKKEFLVEEIYRGQEDNKPTLNPVKTSDIMVIHNAIKEAIESEDIEELRKIINQNQKITLPEKIDERAEHQMICAKFVCVTIDKRYESYNTVTLLEALADLPDNELISLIKLLKEKNNSKLTEIFYTLFKGSNLADLLNPKKYFSIDDFKNNLEGKLLNLEQHKNKLQSAGQKKAFYNGKLLIKMIDRDNPLEFEKYNILKNIKNNINNKIKNIPSENALDLLIWKIELLQDLHSKDSELSQFRGSPVKVGLFNIYNNLVGRLPGQLAKLATKNTASEKLIDDLARSLKM